MLDVLIPFFDRDYATRQIAEASFRKSDLNNKKIQREVPRLESRIEGLTLIVQALCELLIEKTNLRQSDIEAKVEEIDLRDGRQDGKITDRTDKCSKCGRHGLARQEVCMFCGTEIGFGHVVFEKP